jgi:hypothetical protein
MEEDVEKRRVGKTKFALVLSTILMVALVVSNVWTYVNLRGQINSLDNSYNSLYDTYQTYKANHICSNADFNFLSEAYQNYVATHHHTDVEYNDLNDTVNLAKSTVWVDSQTISQPAHSYSYWSTSTSYAGYITVYVQTSTTTNTYVQVIYSAYGVNYDQQVTVGTSGTAVFPVLPCSNIEIRVGNVNLLTGATETVTITCHY